MNSSALLRRCTPRRRVLTVAVTVATVFCLTVATGFAYWVSPGTANGTAATGTLNPPTNVVATSTPGTLGANVSWAAPATGVTPRGYYITRVDSTNATSNACGTSPASLTAATSCVDGPIALGTYTYRVTAVFNSWHAVSAASAPVTVAKADQAITFTSTAPGSAVVAGPTYSVTASGGASGNAVVFTIDSSATGVCSLSGGNVVSFQHTGTCVIDANQAGNGNYNAAPQAQQSFAVGKGAQAITFTSTAPNNAKVAGPTYTVTATGGATGNTVGFTIDSSATGVCSIAGAVVSFQHAGTCVIDANQAGNADYNAALQAQQSFAVGKGDQTITFTSTAPTNATVGSSSYTVTATGGASGNTVTFSIDAATTNSACSIAGAVVSFNHAGTCVVDANQAGSADYNAAPQLQQSIAVGRRRRSPSRPRRRTPRSAAARTP